MTKNNKGRVPVQNPTPKTTDSQNHTGTDPLALTKARLAEQGAEMKAPVVSGQCAEVLSLIRQHQPLLSLVLTADHAIPETAARVHDLRAMGFNITKRTDAKVEFRGRIRRNVALYSLGVPEWPRPGFLAGKDEDSNDE